MNGVILEAIYTSLRSAIHVDACEKSSIEAELVVFKECLSDASLNEKGGAIYVNITQFEVKLSFTRFHGRNRKVKMQFISLHLSDAIHPFNSKMKCQSVSNPFDSFSSVIHYVEKERPNSDGSIMTLSQTDSDTINIVGCGMNETEMCVGL
ncbi:MAG: hypothetical protein EZS28_050994, partial [Streblomastix strix]